ncbi:MAG TPA: aminotransferase class I/II-fold pyridoxal phosphate-dependent enzyme [Streptosporangiaceae bacterium]
MAWYDSYFTADYWAYADAEYTPERTEAEVAYLAGLLAGASRVLDLGCGTGRHAVALARRGFRVTGVDASAYALRRAAQAAAGAGVRLELHQADLLGSSAWGVPSADAAICVQAFGWGSDTDQLRMLRTVRRLLPGDGLFVLDHSSILAITRMYQPSAQAQIGGASFTFSREYDPLTGRSGGQVQVTRPDGSEAVLPDNVRLYTPAEVGALLTRAGFDVTRTDADFQAGAPVTIATRYVQFVATPARRITSALEGHRAQAPPGAIDLRSAPDEAYFSQPAVTAAWARLSSDPLGLPTLARRYDLADPYGGIRSAPVLAANLAWSLSPYRVTAGAGVTGLLHSLARLADGGTILTDPSGHPQLAEAAAAVSSQVAVAPLSDPAAAATAVATFRPLVTVLDRPALTGRHWTLPMIAELARTTAQAGGVLVVDESCACYLPPGASAAPLTDTSPGLIVLRGISKGYCCGGLRIGFAVASPDLAAAVRAVLPPLAASALSLSVALELLTQPDPLAPLRARIAKVKPVIQAAARRAGLPLTETDQHVPWLALLADPATKATLTRCGLVAKEVPVLPATAAPAAPSASSAPAVPSASSVLSVLSASSVLSVPSASSVLSVPSVPSVPSAPQPGLLRMSLPLSAQRLAAVTAALSRAANLVAP